MSKLKLHSLAAALLAALAALYALALRDAEATPPGPAVSAATRTLCSDQPALFYVSRSGSNADGRSWAGAWNELDRIDWSVVRPGDTILIDGGAEQMVYSSTLTVGQSGAPGRPITIRLADEPGRSGQAAIFGGRSTPLPYCGQTGYSYQTSGVRQAGIEISGKSWVVIDGRKWRGIAIYGHNRQGIRLSRPSDITISNVEIYDNGSAAQKNGAWEPNQEGIILSGTNVTVERAIIRDNGQDAIQSANGVHNFTLRQSWLYVSRMMPDGSAVFNRCKHPDGIQIFGGGESNGVLIEDSVIGPGFLHGALLGERKTGQKPLAVVNDVTIRNTLFYKASNANINSMNTEPRNWLLENVTSIRDEGAKWHNIFLDGRGHVIRNSIFVGGLSLSVPKGSVEAEGNCQWEITKGARLGAVIDPRFAGMSGDDFTLKSGSPCSGKGATITSSKSLFAEPAAPAQSASPAGARPPHRS